jgi:hypothetical protein
MREHVAPALYYLEVHLLQAPQPRHVRRATTLALAGLFAAVLLACVVATIAHTSCCFNLPV